MIERIKSLKETLMSQLEGQKGNLEGVDAKEMGEVVDMVKDLSEAEYYCTITKAMADRDKETEEQDKIMAAVMANQGQNYYGGTRYYDPEQWRDTTRMYYTDRTAERRDAPTRSGYSYDRYTGKSPMIRRGYMEAKESHMDSSYQLHELEDYVQQLGTDITEMISDATAEEKMLLKDKLTQLAGKIS